MLVGTKNKKQKVEKCNVIQNKRLVSCLSGALDSECNEILHVRQGKASHRFACHQQHLEV